MLKIVSFSNRSDEVKDHPFFKSLDWQQVYFQKYPPPLIPPRGEVNAADAFDIGSFDEEDTKGIKVNLNILKSQILCTFKMKWLIYFFSKGWYLEVKMLRCK